ADRAGDYLCAGRNHRGGGTTGRIRPAGAFRLLPAQRPALDTAGNGHHQMADPGTEADQVAAIRNQDSFFSGRPLRFVSANSSSCFSLMDSYISFDAPLSSFFLVSPRLAERAAPAAIC